MWPAGPSVSLAWVGFLSRGAGAAGWVGSREASVLGVISASSRLQPGRQRWAGSVAGLGSWGAGDASLPCLHPLSYLLGGAASRWGPFRVRGSRGHSFTNEAPGGWGLGIRKDSSGTPPPNPQPPCPHLRPNLHHSASPFPESTRSLSECPGRVGGGRAGYEGGAAGGDWSRKGGQGSCAGRGSLGQASLSLAVSMDSLAWGGEWVPVVCTSICR